MQSMLHGLTRKAASPASCTGARLGRRPVRAQGFRPRHARRERHGGHLEVLRVDCSRYLAVPAVPRVDCCATCRPSCLWPTPSLSHM
eukprot:scaffold76487_cov69-Phaeocystis_antarctica.AAC.1